MAISSAVTVSSSCWTSSASDAVVAGPVGAVGEVAPTCRAKTVMRLHPPGPGRQQPLRQHQQRVEEHGEHARRARDAVKQLGAEVGEHAVVDEVAEAAVGDQRADRGQRDRRDGRHPQPGHHDRQGQRQLDPEQQLRRGRSRGRSRTRARRRAPSAGPRAGCAPGSSARRARGRSPPWSRSAR